MTNGVETYDFRKPSRLADDVEDILSDWQTRIANIASVRWKGDLALDVEWQEPQLDTCYSREFLAGQTQPTLAYELIIDETTERTWLMIPRPIAIAFVNVMYGIEEEALPEDRPLTETERDVCELLAQRFETSIREAQTCEPALPCRYLSSDYLEEISDDFPQQEQFVIAKFPLKGPFGEISIDWVLSQAAMLRFVTHVMAQREKELRDASPLDRTVRNVPLDVVIRLGKAEVDVSDLMNLRKGDILMLDQRVTEPLMAQIAGTDKFHGWLGTIGNRRGFEVKEMVKEEGES